MFKIKNLSNSFTKLNMQTQTTVGSNHISNKLIELKSNGTSNLLTSNIIGTDKTIQLSFPTLELNGKLELLEVAAWQELEKPFLLRNGVMAYAFQGATQLKGITLQLYIRMAEASPVIRFRFALLSENEVKLTKTTGIDKLNYFTATLPTVALAKEIRFSEFNEKAHATHRTEAVLSEAMFENELSVMGPLMIAGDETHTFMLAYEHGSQYPDRFLEFQLHANASVSVQAVKTNYLDNQIISSENPYESLWFQVGAVAGGEGPWRRPSFCHRILNHPWPPIMHG